MSGILAKASKYRLTRRDSQIACKTLRWLDSTRRGVSNVWFITNETFAPSSFAPTAGFDKRHIPLKAAWRPSPVVHTPSTEENVILNMFSRQEPLIWLALS